MAVERAPEAVVRWLFVRMAAGIAVMVAACVVVLNLGT